MKISLFLVLAIVAAYVAGAKFPGAAKMIGVA